VVNEHYYLWVKTKCPFCIKAKNELLTRIKSFTLYAMDDKPEELEEVKKLWSHTTVPVITVMENDVETFVGGCGDLMKWLEIKQGENTSD